MSRFEPWSEERTVEIIAQHKALEGPLMPILHALQHAFGHVPQETVPVIARELNLSRAEVHGVVTFYHDFRPELPGKHVLKLCRAEACQAMGCDSLVERAESRLGVECGSTSADGRVTLEAVYCLGLCATAPSAMIDGRVVGRLNENRLDELLKEAQS
ncbi:formate dehydrogenase subunit gamma [Hyphomicrobium nitrativorans NL23]|uniref:Formate dehydrogenase subunit gamma n=1 Tax=Hyphomicrobium nitrativorans NL23 TaxID=1029756 RepID=V5SGK1_9HYPH|nr:MULTISPECIES: formate dehydrogenase subunit gamma [Hyphomicrobium]AHB49084.1 formate dehydrogenase subunit gamma [Hyphomicrobium nitrativorans NL23]HRN87237.1 formate dehydrogenase subunit gamma [Hyphomicrobium sp.]HRQ26005.1 formate dehydrogenase subunit gamma [Hyphomicrobium sp.]